MSDSTQGASKAIFFACGKDLIDCRMAAKKEIPQAGSSVELPRRNLHQRSTSARPPEGSPENGTATYRVVSTTAFGAGWDGLNRVVDDRPWEEGECTDHDWCDLFDSYTLASYLKLDTSFQHMPDDAIIIEVERMH